MGKHYNRPEECHDDLYKEMTCCSVDETTPYCCKKDCYFEKELCEDPRTICCKYKDAVVAVESQFVLLGLETSEQEPQNLPLGPNERADIMISGNGFMIENCRYKRRRNHYKKDCDDLTCGKCQSCEYKSTLVVVPASLVLLPPSITSSVKPYPYNDEVQADGFIKNKMVPASRIMVGIFNVNGKGASYSYKAEIVGVDGSGNVALLRICRRDEWNRCLPDILPCHPRIQWGDSCKTKCGDKVYLLGDFITSRRNDNEHNSYTSLTSGVVSDSNYLEHTGWVTAPSILVDAEAYGNPGMPILNCRGCLIGMQTTSVAGSVSSKLVTQGVTNYNSVGDGMVSGPTSRYMKCVIKEFLKGPCRNKGPCERVESVCYSNGSFYRYRKAYLGVAYNVVDPAYGTYTIDYTSGSYAAGERKVRICPNGEFSNGPYDSSIEGVQVVGVAGINPDSTTGIQGGYYYVPGGESTVAPLPQNLPTSPLLGKLEPGDIIVSLIRNSSGLKEKSYVLGDAECQYSPAGLLLKLYPEENVEIVYKKGGSFLNNDQPNVGNNYDCEKCQRVCLKEMPPLMDYPWYSINDFPRVLYNTSPGPSVYPQILSPPNQLNEPQLPALNTNVAFFHPAI